MENLDLLFPNVKTVKIGDKEFKIAPLGPYLMGQIIDYIKDKKRSEIIRTAKELGNVSLADVNELVKKELAAITPDALDIVMGSKDKKIMGDEDVMMHFIFYALQIYQPDLVYSNMGILIDLENIHEIISKILGAENFQKPKPETVEAKV